MPAHHAFCRTSVETHRARESWSRLLRSLDATGCTGYNRNTLSEGAVAMNRPVALAGLLCFALLQHVSAQGPGANAVRSPEVQPDRKVTFRIAAPKAAEVKLTCECFTGERAMTKDEMGGWSVTLGSFEPDINEYEF